MYSRQLEQLARQRQRELRGTARHQAGPAGSPSRAPRQADQEPDRVGAGRARPADRRDQAIADGAATSGSVEPRGAGLALGHDHRGPVSRLAVALGATASLPPGTSTVHGPRRCPATPCRRGGRHGRAATAPVPQDSVSPDPRSCTRISIAWSPVTRDELHVDPARERRRGRPRAARTGRCRSSGLADQADQVRVADGDREARVPAAADQRPSGPAGARRAPCPRSAPRPPPARTVRTPDLVAIASSGPAARPWSSRYRRTP